jgi:FixJ family two-component response regulator
MASAQRTPERHSKPIVFVVDDDASMRDSLELLIRQAGWRPEIFPSAREFLDHPRVNVPRCLVLDIGLPDLNGLELQRRIATDQANMPIIFVTGYRNVPMTVQAMKAGAFEFLTKPFHEDVLLNAIQSALDRSKVAASEDAELEALRGRCALLTSRERDVMDLVTSGFLNKQIGDELGISVITVKAHRGSVMRKMAAASVADLVKINARLRLALTKERHLACRVHPDGNCDGAAQAFNLRPASISS